MKNTKSAISVLLCLSLLFGIFVSNSTGLTKLFDSTSVKAYSVNETSGTCGPDLTWEYDENSQTLTIEGTGYMNYFKTVNIGDVERTSAPWGVFYDSVKTVIIGDNVLGIGDGAFRGCSEISSVTIGKSVTRINSRAFMDCRALKNIYIPENVSQIECYIFAGCSSLKSITVADDNEVYRSSGNCIIRKDNGTLVCGCDNSTIPDDGSIKAIDWGAFYYCTGLTNVLIPDSVEIIQCRAFEKCHSLTSVTIGKYINYIYDYAFLDCTSLENIYIPEKTAFIDSTVFNGCSGLKNITVADDNAVYRSSGNCIINKESKTLVCGCNNSTIPDDGSVIAIDHCAFSRIAGITSVTIPDSIEKIGWHAFAECPDLTSVTIGSGVKEIVAEQFDYCDSLTSLTVDDGNTVYHSSGNCIIDTKNKEVAYGCKNSVIPDDGSVTTIGAYAFFNCTMLTDITIPEVITRLDYAVFYGCSGLENVTLPKSLTVISSSSFQGCSALTDITIPDSVLYIGMHAFYGCTGLKNVVLGKSIEEIDSGAFYRCSGLTTITLPESVSYIGGEAFANCTGLTSISIPVSVTFIDEDAFIGCSSLMYVYYSGNENDGDEIMIFCPYICQVIWLYNCSGEETENGVLKAKLINGNTVSKEKTYDYKTTVTFSVTVPKGGAVQWYVDDEPAGNDETLTVKEKTTDYTVSIIYTDKNGKQIYDEEKVIIKNGFFDKIIWFFKHLFVPNAYIIKQ